MRSVPKPSGSKVPVTRNRRLIGSARTPLAALAAIAVLLEAALLGGLGSSYSTFSSTTANGASSFQAAATFAPNAALFSVGANNSGQLGLGDTSIHYSPVQVGASTWQQVGGGSLYACGVQTGGNLLCWGSNATGQLGVNDNNDRHSPVAPLTSTNFSMATGGSDFTCAVRTDHSLWCWGGNGNGQLGLGNTTGQLTPQHVGSASWTTVTGGQFHACGIQPDKTLWCWGANGSGQVGQGNNTTASYTSPVKVGTATTWTSVATGALTSCGTKSDGTLWCWGDNSHAELGLGNTSTQAYSPSQVPGTTWKTVSMGQYHVCALKTDNSLWCWGENSNGEVGVGTTNTPQMSPQQVTVTTNWKTVSAGYQHTCATRTDSTAWCWGSNTNGQLGLGNTTQETYPWQVPFKTVQAIASGSQSNSTYIISADGGIETNLAKGAFASSGNLSGHAELSAFDNDSVTTYWQSITGFPEWLQVKLGASTSIGRAVISTPELAGWPSFTETITIQASPDSNTWTTIAPSTIYTFNPASGDAVTVTFTPQSFQYWRLNITASTNGSSAQISEFQLYAS